MSVRGEEGRMPSAVLMMLKVPRDLDIERLRERREGNADDDDPAKTHLETARAPKCMF